MFERPSRGESTRGRGVELLCVRVVGYSADPIPPAVAIAQRCDESSYYFAMSVARGCI